jgi:hypothetical protein
MPAIGVLAILVPTGCLALGVSLAISLVRSRTPPTLFDPASRWETAGEVEPRRRATD